MQEILQGEWEALGLLHILSVSPSFSPLPCPPPALVRLNLYFGDDAYIYPRFFLEEEETGGGFVSCSSLSCSYIKETFYI